MNAPCQNDRSAYRILWLAACGLGTLVAMAAALAELRRVEAGNLFALRLPGEAAPSVEELEDAQASATASKYGAVLALLAIGFVVAVMGTQSRIPLAASKLPSVSILFFFGLAVLADLLTTIHFFHAKGIPFELHPGIRLFGYAYGRTIGPLLGKTLQALGVLAFASVLGSRGGWFVLAVGTVYTAAAVYNVVNW